MTALHKAMDKIIDSEGTTIGDFWGLLTFLEIEPPLKLLNQKGEYSDRFRKDLEDHYPIQLDVAVRSRLRCYPLEELSEFIRHLQMIVKDAEQIKDTLERVYGIREDNFDTYGFASVMKPVIHQKLDDILADPIAFSNKFSEKDALSLESFKFGKSVLKAIIETKKELING
jgi:hypothetical protein